MFSAKGAAFIASLGQRPKIHSSPNASAEGAIDLQQWKNGMNRAISACSNGASNSWSDAPS
jgi:hypothetical protein